MQFKAVVLAALATGALAQTPSLDAEQSRSVLSVLRTALPTSLLYEALTNPAAVSSEIASEFSAGETPSWYANLPNDIKTLLQPNITAAATGLSSVTGFPNATAITGNSTILPTGGFSNSTAGSNSTTSRSSSRSSSLTTTSSSGSSSSGSSGSGSGSSATSGSESSSTGNGASLPTAVFGMGLAGAAGLMGVLVL